MCFRSPRGMFEDCWVAPDGTARPINHYSEVAPLTFVAEIGGGRLEKSYAIAGGRLVARYRARNIAGRFEIRINAAMPSCDGYAGRYVLESGATPCGFGQVLELTSARRLTLNDGVLGGTFVIATSQPVTITARPHHTVAQSEAGFEKIMQAVEIALLAREWRHSTTSKRHQSERARAWAGGGRMPGSSSRTCVPR